MPVSMPQFRFPFTKKTQPTPAAPPSTEEAPVSHGPVTETTTEDVAPRGHRREKSTGSISIMSRSSREEDNNIYKLSVVNDSGIYLPPSPSEKKSFWGKSESSTPSIKEVPDTEDMGFGITRESFDGYRRSFDISAKTPVSDSQRLSLQSSRSSFDSYAYGRQSLDSRLNRLPSIDVSESASDEEEEFREVDLNESQPPKKRGFLGRFVGGHSGPQPTAQPTRYFTDESEDIGKRQRSNTALWRREHNKDAEELSAVLKGSNHLISV